MEVTQATIDSLLGSRTKLTIRFGDHNNIFDTVNRAVCETPKARYRTTILDPLSVVYSGKRGLVRKLGSKTIELNGNKIRLDNEEPYKVEDVNVPYKPTQEELRKLYSYDIRVNTGEGYFYVEVGPGTIICFERV